MPLGSTAPGWADGGDIVPDWLGVPGVWLGAVELWAIAKPVSAASAQVVIRNLFIAISFVGP